MHLKSKINLNYSLPIAGQAEGIIVGKILTFEMDGELTKIEASYDYSILSGSTSTTITRGRFMAEGEELTNLYTYTDSIMPEGLSSREQEQYRRYAAFQSEMVQTFSSSTPGLTISDIEIVTGSL